MNSFVVRSVFFPVLLIVAIAYAVHVFLAGCTSFETALMLLGITSLSYITSYYNEEHPFFGDVLQYLTYGFGILFVVFVAFFWK